MSIKKCMLIGDPVEHSLSDSLHNIIYDYFGLKDWRYIKKRVPGNELENFTKEATKTGCIGFNVTIPHKQAVMPYLDGTSDAVKKMGAVNTVKNENGKLTGHNTDWKGFIEDIEQELGIGQGGDEHILLLGAGGAARAVVYGLKKMGKKNIFIYDINRERALNLADEFSLCLVEKEDLGFHRSRAKFLINATPLGMKKEEPSPLRLDDSRDDLRVYDLIYNRETELLKSAREMGLRAASGEGMLAGQGIEAFRIWSGFNIRDDEKRELKDRITGFIREEVGK